tara:strand:+ start:863 stop:1906 length:1044 start_codon:yes stop_codon:yes gene_type:complete
MSSKYYWEGVDMNNLTSSSSTDGTIGGYFSNFPGGLQNNNTLSSEPTGMVTNETSFSALPSPNTSYFCYNDDEADDAPPFQVNGTSIFSSSFSSKRLLVSNVSLSKSAGNGTLSIPSWCNGVKIVFYSTKGNDGTTSTSNVSGQNTNQNEHNDDYYVYDHNYRGDRGFYRSRHHNNHRNHHHRHVDRSHNYDSKTGGTGGTGGTGRVGWFLKGVTFTAGSNNTVDYSITQTATANSIITIKESGSDKAVITFGNGGNGGNGSAAQLGTINNNHVNDNNEHHNHGAYHHNNQNHYNHTNGSADGADGADGANGNISFTGQQPTYIYYNNSSTSIDTRVTIYYFRYKTS